MEESKLKKKVLKLARFCLADTNAMVGIRSLNQTGNNMIIKLRVSTPEEINPLDQNRLEVLKSVLPIHNVMYKTGENKELGTIIHELVFLVDVNMLHLKYIEVLTLIKLYTL